MEEAGISAGQPSDEVISSPTLNQTGLLIFFLGFGLAPLYLGLVSRLTAGCAISGVKCITDRHSLRKSNQHVSACKKAPGARKRQSGRQAQADPAQASARPLHITVHSSHSKQHHLSELAGRAYCLVIYPSRPLAFRVKGFPHAGILWLFVSGITPWQFRFGSQAKCVGFGRLEDFATSIEVCI